MKFAHETQLAAIRSPRAHKESEVPWLEVTGQYREEILGGGVGSRRSKERGRSLCCRCFNGGYEASVVSR